MAGAWLGATALPQAKKKAEPAKKKAEPETKAAPLRHPHRRSRTVVHQFP